MNAFQAIAGRRCQVAIEAIGKERCNRCHQFAGSQETSIERLVSAQLILRHRTGPEAFTIQTHIPIREVVGNESIDQATGFRRLIIVQSCRYFFHHCIEFAQYPTINFRALTKVYLRCVRIEVVNVCIHCKERVSLIEFTEEGARNFLDTLFVKLQIVPRRSIGNHIPTQGVRAIFSNRLKRIYGIAEALRHFITVLIQDKAVRDNILEGNGIEDHRRNSVERKEPAARLINAFSNEVGREAATALHLLFVFERIVLLCKGHCA